MMTAADTAPTREALWAALATVRDPELDEPITELGFVTVCQVAQDRAVRVVLKLPTYFCAANFAYLMAADAFAAVSALAGVGTVEVLLEDHFAAAEINAGVAARAGFVETFEGLATGELGQLRIGFLRKAVLAATDRVCRPLLQDGRRPEDLARLTLGDVASSPDLDRLRGRRSDLGLSHDDTAVLVVDPETGAPIAAHALQLHLRKARLTRVNAEANGEICRGLFRERYPELHIRKA